MKKSNLFTAMAVLALGAAACASDATSPVGEEGTMQVVMYGDAGASSASESAERVSAGSVSGTVDVRARVYVRTQAGAWTELTKGAAARGTASMSSAAQGTVLTTSAVAARSYTHVRVVFEDVRAQVTGGLTVGAGLLQGEVRLGGTGQTTVERAVRFDVRSGSTAQLAIDLNAQSWLRQADAGSRTVAEAAFRSAVGIRVD